MAQPLFPNLKPVLLGRVNSPAFSLSGLKMADKKDINGGKTSILTVVNTAARSRQELIGPVFCQFYGHFH